MAENILSAAAPAPDTASTNANWLGLLKVQVVEAAELLSMDFGGKSDPFCVISHGPATFRTEVVKKTLSPVWNQELRLPVQTYSLQWPISFSVYDWDKVGKNDFIGRVDLDPKSLDLQDGLVHDVWLELAGEKKRGGKIHIVVRYFNKATLEQLFWTSMAKYFDADGDKVIGQTELTAMLQTMDAAIDEAQIEELFSRADTDGSGDISYEELVTSMAQISTPLFAHFHTCPICKASFKNPCDAEVISHLGMCLDSQEEGAQKFVMGGFLSEEFASRSASKSWFARLGRPKSSDDICSNPEVVIVMDRRTGKVQEEFIPPTIRMALRSLYQSAIGSKAANTARVRKLLANMTAKYGLKFTDPKSVKEIAAFVKLHKLDLDEILEPIESFKNFNEFFYRKLKREARPIDNADPRVVVAPADCRCVVFPTIDQATSIWVKGQKFSVEALLGDSALASRYVGGSLGIFRLAPQDYHRFHIPVDATVGPSFPLGSAFYTVNPMAVRARQFDVFTENKRLLTPLITKTIGAVLYIAVGATMVGSINLTVKEGATVNRGDEFGYFAFGGSTVLLLFEPGTITWDNDLLTNSGKPLETLIRMGTRIAMTNQ
eukprot:TRINITY_DN1467_c0_g1_i1.p1 TRINITY_DN1467_c0_g1~~TRINITY_DN1467_c0_g1_i1.p1  ORF type:complete len:617 (-),score=136.05 TRINITY_DN1467_c0_g1_i1:1302-3110(-)